MESVKKSFSHINCMPAQRERDNSAKLNDLTRCWVSKKEMKERQKEFQQKEVDPREEISLFGAIRSFFGGDWISQQDDERQQQNSPNTDDLFISRGHSKAFYMSADEDEFYEIDINDSSSPSAPPAGSSPTKSAPISSNKKTSENTSFNSSSSSPQSSLNDQLRDEVRHCQWFVSKRFCMNAAEERIAACEALGDSSLRNAILHRNFLRSRTELLWPDNLNNEQLQSYSTAAFDTATINNQFVNNGSRVGSRSTCNHSPSIPSKLQIVQVYKA